MESFRKIQRETGYESDGRCWRNNGKRKHTSIEREREREREQASPRFSLENRLEDEEASNERGRQGDSFLERLVEKFYELSESGMHRKVARFRALFRLDSNALRSRESDRSELQEDRHLETRCLRDTCISLIDVVRVSSRYFDSSNRTETISSRRARVASAEGAVNLYSLESATDHRRGHSFRGCLFDPEQKRV